jgi:hypothetical protein
MAAVPLSLSLKIADPAAGTSARAATARGAVVNPSIHLEIAGDRYDSIDHLPRPGNLRKHRVQEMLVSEVLGSPS